MFLYTSEPAVQQRAVQIQLTDLLQSPSDKTDIVVSMCPKALMRNHACHCSQQALMKTFIHQQRYVMKLSGLEIV